MRGAKPKTADAFPMSPGGGHDPKAAAPSCMESSKYSALSIGFTSIRFPVSPLLFTIGKDYSLPSENQCIALSNNLYSS
jgi:hypothetical protein